MDYIDITIINHLQHGFPLCTSPYQRVAEQLGVTETNLLGRIQMLLDTRVLSRFGPLYHAEKMGGAITLATVKVPENCFESIADIINAFPEVAHNYARDHAFNMWFVIATDTLERIDQVIQDIEKKTGLIVYNMPKIKEYFVQLKLDAA